MEKITKFHMLKVSDRNRTKTPICFSIILQYGKKHAMRLQMILTIVLKLSQMSWEKSIEV